MNVEEVMLLAPVIPVLVIEDASHARVIAESLVAGGLKALEVTLRTPAALDVIREMTKVEGAVDIAALWRRASADRGWIGLLSSCRRVHIRCWAVPVEGARAWSLAIRAFVDPDGCLVVMGSWF